MKSVNRAKPRGSRSGVSMIECAIVLPLFAMLVLGILEFGRAFMVSQVVTNSAREGARIGTMPTSTSNSQIEARVNDFLADAGITTATTTVSVDSGSLAGASRGDAVTVQVSVPFTDVSLLSPRFLEGINLTSTSVMRRE